MTPVHQEGHSFPMASPYVRIRDYNAQVPPVVSELEAIFAELPDEALLTRSRAQGGVADQDTNPKFSGVAT